MNFQSKNQVQGLICVLLFVSSISSADIYEPSQTITPVGDYIRGIDLDDAN